MNHQSITIQPGKRHLGAGLVLALIFTHGPAFAADRATCSMALMLLEETDRGLEAAAADAPGAFGTGVGDSAGNAGHLRRVSDPRSEPP